MQTDASIILLDTNLIVPNKYQPRKVFEENSLNTLAESIKNYGIINPILVRKKDDKYEIIAGERRFRAAKKIGLTEIPVIVKTADEQQMAELALIENLERQGLSSIEEAKAYEEIMRIGNQTQESLAKKLGKSQSAISNKIRLLSLPSEIQIALSNKKISERHARSLINISDKQKQIELLNKIINEKLTVKETEMLINQREITETEIKNAIDDIMKSLSSVNETQQEPKNEIKKEEKEDENMNNGNFFPNFDNNGMNNNTSLNMMNVQSQTQEPMPAATEMVMPTMTPPMQEQQFAMPSMEQPLPQPAPMMMNQEPQMMVPEIPQMPINNNPIPDFAQFNGMPPMDQPLPQQPTPMEMPNMAMNEQPVIPVEQNPIPSFGQFMEQQTMVNQNPEQITTPMTDQPLFNPNAMMPTNEPAPMMMNQEPATMNPAIPSVPIENPSFSVPVSSPNQVQTEFAVPTGNRLVELQSYLSSNGYEFKLYNNEMGSCIIIELPRN